MRRTSDSRKLVHQNLLQYARTHTRNYLNRIFNKRSERHRVKLRFTIYYLSAQRQKETFCIKKCVEIRPPPHRAGYYDANRQALEPDFVIGAVWQSTGAIVV